MISLKQILSKSTLARNAVWMLGGRGVRMVIQAIYFLVIARALGASQYGAFVGAVSLVAIAFRFPVGVWVSSSSGKFRVTGQRSGAPGVMHSA